MKQFAVILFLSVLGATVAENGYNYPEPAVPALLPPAPVAPVSPNIPINGGGFHAGLLNGDKDIYSPVQGPLLSQYHAQYKGHGLSSQSGPLALPEVSQGPRPLPLNNGQNQDQGLAFNSQSGFNQQQQLNFQQNVQQQSNFQQNTQQIDFQQNRYQQQQNFQPQRQQIITKDIYIHSAPEDQEDTVLGEDLSRNSPIRKNYRIVFIKAPSTNIKLAANALRNAQSANEEKTVIYVLSKKPDLSEVQAQLQQVNGEQKTSKPEVYFIKYKTQEEAARAQQEIQAQYDALGGSTRITDEGIAPVTSFSNIQHGQGNLNLAIPISAYARSGLNSYSQQDFQSSSIGAGSTGGVSTPSNGYLPSKAKK